MIHVNVAPKKLPLIAIGIILLALPIVAGVVWAQTGRAEDATAKLPAFQVATVKPVNPNRSGPVGFLSYPGGRVLVGYAAVKMIIGLAFDVPEFQIAGGPSWIGADRYDVVGLPPDDSESRMAKQSFIKATPSEEQRKMLQSLLLTRFGLKFHLDSKEERVYILSRGAKKLQLQDPNDKDADARASIPMDRGNGFDGEAFGTNISMSFLARQLSFRLQTPVLDRTGLQGTYDFHLPPDGPPSQDMTASVLHAVDRLGLKFESGRGPVEVIVIDHVERPSEN